MQRRAWCLRQNSQYIDGLDNRRTGITFPVLSILSRPLCLLQVTPVIQNVMHHHQNPLQSSFYLLFKTNCGRIRRKSELDRLLESSTTSSLSVWRTALSHCPVSPITSDISRGHSCAKFYLLGGISGCHGGSAALSVANCVIQIWLHKLTVIEFILHLWGLFHHAVRYLHRMGSNGRMIDD
jgi:hypothetical protein